MSQLITAKVEGGIGVWKTELAELLEVHLQTLMNWHKECRTFIPDYRGRNYTLTGQLIKIKPLDPYEVWVLKKYQLLINSSKNYEVVAKYIKQNLEKFSESTYQKEA